MPKEIEPKAAPRRLGVVSQLIGDKAATLDNTDTRNREALIVAIEKLRPNPQQPRQVFDAERDAELAENIRENGILEPLLVRLSADNSYEIVAGERRYRAARAIGLKNIPVIVKDYDDRQAQLVAAVENLQRVDLDPLDEARYFRFLANIHNYSYREIAELVHRSRSYVNERMRQLEISENPALQTRDDSDEMHNRPKNGQKLGKSQSGVGNNINKSRKFSLRPLDSFDGWLEDVPFSINSLATTERDDLRQRITDLRKRLTNLEDMLS